MSLEDAAADVLGDWYARGAPESLEDLLRAHPELEAPLRAAIEAGDVVARALGARRAAGVEGGRTIGDFRVVREIGRGGMGVVYEAEQVSLRRRVALKVLSPAVTLDAKAVERFRREAQTAGRLVHPHIVPVHAMGEADGVWYFAMEWVRGTTLARVVEDLRAGRPSPLGSPSEGRAYYARLAVTMADAAGGLEAAHRAGVVHRDVKPANLVLDENGALKVTDFGLALVEGEISRTVTGDLLGTPAYMSPEQAGGGHLPVDARSDVYSLGATLYELLTLRAPFEGRNAHAVCVRILTKDPPAARRIDPRIPRDLETIVARAMEKAPGRRYPTAQALADDLRAFANGRAILARAVGPLGRAARSARRHKALAALGAAVLVLAGTVGYLALGGGLRPERGAPARTAWTSLPPIPVASSGLGAVVLGGKLYAVSGWFTPRVSVYDPAIRQWSPVAPLPEAIQYASTVVANGRIHVFGGDTGGSKARAATLVYDPASDAWTSKAPMAGGARWATGAAEIDGKVYVVGGTDGGPIDALDRLEVYDPLLDAWATKAPLPEARPVSGAVGAIGGRLYVAGGIRGGQAVLRLDVYDPATDTWTSKAAPPVGVSTQAAVVEGRLVLVGGGLGDDQGVVHAYDPATDAWSALPSLNQPRRAHGVAYDPVSKTLYAVSGYSGGGWVSSVEALTPVFAPQ